MQNGKNVAMGCLGCFGIIVVIAIIFSACSAFITRDAKIDKSKPIKDEVTKVVHKEFGDKPSYNDKDSIIDIIENKGYVTIKVYGDPGVTDAKSSNLMRISKVAKKLKEDDRITGIFFMITLPLTDQYGNKSDDTVMKVELKRDTLDKIDFENFNDMNLPQIADEYWEHPAITKY